MIGEVAEQPAAEWAYQKASREKYRRVELLHHRVFVRKECAGEIERKRGVAVKVIPFDQVADRADEDRLEAPPHVREVEMLVRYGRALRDGISDCGHCGPPGFPRSGRMGPVLGYCLRRS